jgi:Rieske 2Fe-2S family protein
VCRHRGAELVDRDAPACGAFGGSIRCPYHSWTYGLDGRLRRTPFLGPVSDSDADAFALVPVAVDTWGGFVFVHLDPAPAGGLLDQLGEIPERVTRYPLRDVRAGAHVTYEVAANWKVLAENYNECYHCGPVHPELCDLVPSFRRGGGDALDWERGIPHRDGAYTFTTTGTTTRAPFPDLDEDELVRHKGELVFPNLLLSLACDHIASFLLTPRGPGHTTIDFDLLFHPDAIADPGFDPSDALELWDVVNRQDWRICESVQRGMASRGFTQGWFAPMEDPSLDIRGWYEPRMTDP